MPDIDSSYLKNMPSSDLYGDEDGFDMDIELKWTDDEDYLDDAEKEARAFKELEIEIIYEGTAYVSRNEAGYLCCEVDPCLDQRLVLPDPAEEQWGTESIGSDEPDLFGNTVE